MENIPENNDFFAEDLGEQEESTIFSAPVSHSRKNQNKQKKPLFKLISIVLVAAIVITGSIIAIKKIPTENTENPSDNSFTADKTIDVLISNQDDFKTVTVKNENGSFVFYPAKANEDGEEVTNWYLKGYDKELVSDYYIGTVVSTIANLTATKEITEMSPSDCGLDKPEVSVNVSKKDGSSFSVSISGTTYDNKECYFKTADSDKIYTTTVGFKDTFIFTDLELAASPVLPGFDVGDITGYTADDGSLVTFDKITLTGKNFKTPLVIEPNDDELLSALMAYIVTKPTKRIAESQSVDSVFNIFKSGLSASASEIYAFDVKPATLKKFGLHSPDLVAKMTIKGKSLTYKFSLQKDGSYAVICDSSKVVGKIDASSVPFTEYKLNNYYSSYVCMISIDTLEYFELKIGKEKYKFSITSTVTDTDETEYEVTLDGKPIDFEKFQNAYMEIVSLACSDFTTSKINSSPDYTFTFKFNKEDGGGKTVTEFYKISDTRYQYATDGVNLGKVNSYSLRKVIETLEKFF